MLLYNWDKILSVSNGKIKHIVAILRMITYKQLPKNYYDSTYKYRRYKFGGYSFLLNPKELLEKGRTYSDSEVVEYAGVASFRSYHNFNETKDTTLDLLHCPVSQDLIINNRLLDIKANRIHFMFEEPQGEI
mgnify:FL=1|tara:strand:- start:674 stop:1069 length:396 start_codon:yes stop_codon:yes gene_type:complete